MSRKPQRLRDWLVGSTGKRLLLRALIAEPKRTWSKAELARKAKVHEKGGLDEHLVALVQMKLLRAKSSGYALNTRSSLVRPLDDLLVALERLPNPPVNRP